MKNTTSSLEKNFSSVDFFFPLWDIEFQNIIIKSMPEFQICAPAN